MKAAVAIRGAQYRQRRRGFSVFAVAGSTSSGIFQTFVGTGRHTIQGWEWIRFRGPNRGVSFPIVSPAPVPSMRYPLRSG